jgi:hypothetical protein
MDNQITTQIYTEYFNIIHLEHELFNTILNRQSTINNNLHRMLLNYQNYILYPDTVRRRRNNITRRDSLRPTITPIRTVRNPMRSRPRISIREPPRTNNASTNTHFPPTDRNYQYVFPSFTSTFRNLRSRNLNTNSNSVSLNTLINETTNFIWSDSSNNNFNICPIARTPFVEGTYVTKINNCGHIFNHTELLTWFSRNNTCPVCRYNLNSCPHRPYNHNNNNNNNNNTTTTSTSTSTSTNTNNSIFNNSAPFNFDLSNNIFNDISRSFAALDISHNLVSAEFEFNLPLNVPYTPPNNEFTAFSEDEEGN